MSVFPNSVYKHNKWIDVIWMNKALQEFKDDIKDPVSIWDLDKELVNNIFFHKPIGVHIITLLLYPCFY